MPLDGPTAPVAGARLWAALTEATAPAEPLTRDTLLKAAADLERYDERHRASGCAIGQHVVSPRVLEEGGWTLCANCNCPVYVDHQRGTPHAA